MINKDTPIATKPEPPLQRMLDEQGYLVIASRKKMKIGMLVGGTPMSNTFRPTDYILAVVGESDHDEFKRQSVKYTGAAPLRRHPYYYRVVAE